jgi:vacuolar-type H+-ATPase subunit I/STV1
MSDKLNYLKSKQDQKVKNFGMVGMGYVVEVVNEYEAELESLKSQLVTEIANREAVDSLCANYKSQLAQRDEWLREADEKTLKGKEELVTTKENLK